MTGFYDVLSSGSGECPPDCSLCEEACTAAKGDGREARIFHLTLPEAGITHLVKCNQCSEPACAEVCPTHAITRSDTDGVVRINQQRCAGCGLCSMACPYGGIHYSPEDEKVFYANETNLMITPDEARALSKLLLDVADISSHASR